jgi:hypothetical protein
MTPLRALTGILLCSLVSIVPLSRAQDCGTNAWTKPTSGYWEESFWSCDRLPGLDQWLIAFTNSGSKTLTIGENTTGNFSNSLAINDLMVDAPDGSANELLLNYAGTNTPLSIHDLKLGPNGSLVSYNSALSGYTLYLNSRALFAQDSLVQVRSVSAAGNVTFRNSSSSLGWVLLRPGAALNQFGGTSDIGAAVLDADSIFTLENGTLSMSELCLSSYPGIPLPGEAHKRRRYFPSGSRRDDHG